MNATTTTVNIALALSGAQEINASIQRLVQQVQQALGGMGRAGGAAGQQTAGAFEAAQARMEQLRGRIERAQRAYEALRQSGQATAQALAAAAAQRDRIVDAAQGKITQLQPARVAGAREELGVRPNADIQAEINRARQAFDALRASGTLSATEIAQAQLKLRERIAELQAQTNGFAQSFLKVKESVAAVVGAALAFRAASASAISFEAAMADVRKVVDATPEGFAKITRDIRDLSTELPITAVGLAQMAEAGGQLGIVGEQIPEFVRLAAEMSVAFKISADESGTAVGKLSNIFGLSLPRVRALADSVNALGDSSAATERDIVNVLQRTGGMGRQFGLSAEQVSALAASMVSLGDPPEIAATAINNLLSKLQAAPQQSADFLRVLKVLGVDAKSLAGSIERDAQGALLDFLGTLEQLDAKSRSQALSGLFGSGGDTATLAKLTGNLDLLRTALRTAQAEAAQGGLAKALQIQLETADSQLTILRNSFSDIGIAMGAALLPAIKIVAGLVSGLAQLIATVVDAAPVLSTLVGGALGIALSFGALRIAAAAIGLAISKLGVSLGLLVPGLVGAGAASAGASVGVGLLGGAMRLLLGPVGLVSLALTGLIALWDKLADAKRSQPAASAADLTQERQAIQGELDRIRAGAARGRVGLNVQAEYNELKARAAQIDAQLKALERSGKPDATPAGDGGRDITAELAALGDAARQAARARLDADKAAREAQATLAADANARELAGLQRRLEAETLSLDGFYASKQRLARADVDAQIRLREQELAALGQVAQLSAAQESELRSQISQREARQAALKPQGSGKEADDERKTLQGELDTLRADLARGRLASDAEAQQQRAERSRLQAEITKLRRDRDQIPADFERERNAAELKLAEQAARERLGITQRTIDAELDLVARAQTAGQADAAELAAASERAAMRRVQAEVDAADAILAARKRLNAPAADQRAAQADADTARGRRAEQRTSTLAEAGEQLRRLREQARDIRIGLVTDPQARELRETELRIERLRREAGSITARLRVQIDAEPDPGQRERLEAQLRELTGATADAVAAENEALAERLKPGWRRMVEGWQDTQRLMREATDNAMQGILGSAEDAFVKFAQTGKLSVKGMVDTIIAELARVQFRQAVAGSSGQGLLNLIASFLPGAGGGSAGASAPMLDYSLPVEGVKFKAAGGLITGPGSGTSDDVPAMLSNGEFVIRAAAVQRLGLGLLARLNQADRVPAAVRRALPAFATGGLVGASAAAAGVPSAAPAVQVVVNNTAPGTQASAREGRGPDGRSLVNVLVEQVEAAVAGNISRGAGPLAGAMQRTYGLNRAAGAY